MSTNRQKEKTSNILYNYGISEALVGGLYEGTISVKSLKQKGDFGLGAPGMLDGELTILDGKAYQTKSDGETTILKDDYMIAFSCVTFFEADLISHINTTTARESLFRIITNTLENKNAMYAIKITGEFEHIRTRAFPPTEAPFPILSTILDKQRVFNFNNVQGTLIGYFLPEYLNGINVSGFHFHFLSTDKKHGGHLLDFTAENLKIEIAELKSMELEVSSNPSFHQYRFRNKRNEDLEKVGRGY
ncbi:alpha-acetolactate decarboxylase [Elizabethkingia sp. HvH-WGS333]|uniref:acetolactate decarboxylase n=1 Tax=Elizabethkingia TaxID=308865 RepID=UPI00074164E5|nr:MULTISPECIES: acetolactate decarboxylase [Elizabethkingia]KUG11401.1 acetolactate decarboxylase [Elizabethkingia miricola]MCL1657749.1 acetolactate decarboxylase [Elizabethkingia miricola]OIK48474.1 alpha-acetolactate decarboxylase [Elizabethkingia sp. HvH-WGS333]